MELFDVTALAGRLAVRYQASLAPQQLRLFVETSVLHAAPVAEAVVPAEMMGITHGFAGDGSIDPGLGTYKLVRAPDVKNRSTRLEWIYEVTALSPRFFLHLIGPLAMAAPPPTLPNGVLIEGSAPLGDTAVTEREILAWAQDEQNFVEAFSPVPFFTERQREDDKMALRVVFSGAVTPVMMKAFEDHFTVFLAFCDRISNGREEPGYHGGALYSWALDEVTVRVEKFDHESELSIRALTNILCSVHSRVVPIQQATFFM